MRWFLILCMIGLVLSSLFCEEPQINLPDVIITGEHTIKAELPVTQIDLSKYTQTDTTKSFQYVPGFIPLGLNDPKKQNHEQCGYLNGMGGNRRLISFNGMYRSHTNPLLNFSANGYQYHLSAFWNQTYTQFQWLPEFVSYRSQLGVQSVLVDTHLSNSKTEITGATIGVIQKNDAMFPTFMKGTDLSLTFINGQEDTDYLTSIRDYNLSFKTLIPMTSNEMMKIRYEYLNLHSQGVFSMYSNRIKQLQRSGLWVGADKKRLYPSLDLLCIYPLKDKFDMYISNEPYLKSEDVLSAFRVNSWQHLNGLRKNDLQEKALLNTTFGFEMHSTFHVSVSHRLQYRQEMPVYQNVQYKLYDRSLVNCMVQTTEVKLGYGIDKLVIQNALQFHQYKSEKLATYGLPYASTWQVNLSATYQSPLGMTSCLVRYEIMRKDHNDKTLPDVILFNVRQDIPVQKNLWINVSLENILDKHIIMYAEVPYQPFNASIGGTVTF